MFDRCFIYDPPHWTLYCGEQMKCTQTTATHSASPLPLGELRSSSFRHCLGFVLVCPNVRETFLVVSYHGCAVSTRGSDKHMLSPGHLLERET